MGKIIVKVNGLIANKKQLTIKRPRWVDMLNNYPGGNISIEKVYEKISKNLSMVNNQVL